ncbi:MAG: hypothetical protein ACOVJ5_00570 [Gloeomargaritales cyanobacterium]
MRVLSDKETDLITMAVIEGIMETQNKLWIDFKIGNDSLTVHQQHRLNQITDLLYTLFCEVVEEDGILQSEYDQ